MVLLGLLRFSKAKLLYPWSVVVDYLIAGVRFILGSGKRHLHGGKKHTAECCVQVTSAELYAEWTEMPSVCS